MHLISDYDFLDVELNDVVLNHELEKVLQDERWVDDASGLIPHALDVLRACHLLTERLVAMTCGRVNSKRLTEVIQVCTRCDI